VGFQQPFQRAIVAEQRRHGDIDKTLIAEQVHAAVLQRYRLPARHYLLERTGLVACARGGAVVGVVMAADIRVRHAKLFAGGSIGIVHAAIRAEQHDRLRQDIQNLL